MKVAIIGGTGGQGLGIAVRFVQAGEDVIIGSRTMKKAKAAVDKLKDLLGDVNNVKAAENADAAKEAELLVLTVPLAAQKSTLLSIKEGSKGKILLDATGPLESAIGGSPITYLDLWDGAAAERSAKILKDTYVVCAFNNISSAALMNFKEPIDCDCLISGDDVDSKAVATELIEKIPGVNVIDCGPLERAKIIEKITPLLIGLNIRNKTQFGGIRITGLGK
ncbi:NADPH-dependent F420 reductase [Methanobacterium petrolearium]|uniref:NADPH-dependent F420 reductase n=1 Tax=Methanobacterium petrolearium TaxID=710190 RepID=UPI001AE4ADED|nr:NADPH-dependent F420 reductase [Methanobacterium petrolearium]MBP1945209.1 NADPH-dependent F420 reductase [Methanobacterium petrolearium]BDZ71142.1 NADPH-dependent F420 reductase [Methanobacterium petrolearium]